MICCVSKAKIYFEHQKFMISFSFAVFFSIFKFFKFLMILSLPHCQIRLRGLISCPGLLLNQSRLEFSSYSDFSVHMVFMCRPCVIEISVAIHILELEPSQNSRFFLTVSISEFHVINEFSNLTNISQQAPKSSNSQPAVNRQPGFRREDSQSLSV